MATQNINTHRYRYNERLYLELVMLLNLPINKKPNRILIILNIEYYNRMMTVFLTGYIMLPPREHSQSTEWWQCSWLGTACYHYHHSGNIVKALNDDSVLDWVQHATTQGTESKHWMMTVFLTGYSMLPLSSFREQSQSTEWWQCSWLGTACYHYHHSGNTVKALNDDSVLDWVQHATTVIIQGTQSKHWTMTVFLTGYSMLPPWEQSHSTVWWQCSWLSTACYHVWNRLKALNDDSVLDWVQHATTQGTESKHWMMTVFLTEYSMLPPMEQTKSTEWWQCSWLGTACYHLGNTVKALNDDSVPDWVQHATTQGTESKHWMMTVFLSEYSMLPPREHSQSTEWWPCSWLSTACYHPENRVKALNDDSVPDWVHHATTQGTESKHWMMTVFLTGYSMLPLSSFREHSQSTEWWQCSWLGTACYHLGNRVKALNDDSVPDWVQHATTQGTESKHWMMTVFLTGYSMLRARKQSHSTERW